MDMDSVEEMARRAILGDVTPLSGIATTTPEPNISTKLETIGTLITPAPPPVKPKAAVLPVKPTAIALPAATKPLQTTAETLQETWNGACALVQHPAAPATATFCVAFVALLILNPPFVQGCRREGASDLEETPRSPGRALTAALIMAALVVLVPFVLRHRETLTCWSAGAQQAFGRVSATFFKKPT
jgi:hypothetical protein